MKYYFFEESSNNPHKYLLRPNFDVMPLQSTTGSFQILAARLMNLSWPDYLRMCRDLLGAEIIGKGKMYPIIYFTLDKNTQAFLKLLNKRVDLALKYRENPDFNFEKENNYVSGKDD